MCLLDLSLSCILRKVASEVCLAVLAPEIAHARVKGFFSKYNKARPPVCAFVPSLLVVKNCTP